MLCNIGIHKYKVVPCIYRERGQCIGEQKYERLKCTKCGKVVKRKSVW